jgi:hypothetical protein
MTFPAHGWRKCRSPAWRSHLSWSCFMSKPVSYILFLASNQKNTFFEWSASFWPTIWKYVA